MNIKQVISEMTLEEKCSLLSGRDFWNLKSVDRLGVASVMVSDGPHGLRKQATAGDHLGINDSIPAVCFPAASASAASFDRELLFRIGEGVGEACQAENLSVILGPAVNIKRSPLCGRNFEYFSEDPYLTGELAANLVKGVQSKNIGTSVKHFAGNSQEHRRMSSDSVIDERTLREIYLTAFEKIVKQAKPWTIMCSYNRLNGTYACENKWLLTDVLRDEWGFDGYVMSDWGATDDRVECVEAGLDLEMPASGGANDARVVKAVREGRLDEAVVDRAVERILTVNELYLQSHQENAMWDKEAQHVLARKLAAECMVLLKNDDAILPLRQGEKIVVIGEFAKKPRYQGGGSSHINSFKVTSLLDVMNDAEYAQGYETARDVVNEDLLHEAIEKAKCADKVVIVAGLPDAFESEGYDRTHMRMPDCQNILIQKIAEVNPNTIVVLYNGSPVEMPWIGKAKAVIEAYLGGQAVGGATKDVLFGFVNPCGRLPETFPIKMEHNPSYLTYGGEGDRAVYSEGVFVGYRYYEKKKMPVLFPFGYGLSYTTFEYANLTVSADAIKDTDTLTVTVDVKNTGAVAGKTVVQLYIADRESTVFRPVRELKGFEKVMLQPGETKTIAFELDKRAFAYWNADLHDWHVETGAFGVQICTDSATVALEKEVVVESTVEIPKRYTVSSIMMDLMRDPKAIAALKPMLDAMAQFAGGMKSDEDKDRAVNDNMMEKMLGYMPLRALAAFAGGAITYDQLQSIIDGING